MQADAKPRIEITVDEEGVDGVKLYAATPEAEEIALDLFQQVRPLLRQFRLQLHPRNVAGEKGKLLN